MRKLKRVVLGLLSMLVIGGACMPLPALAQTPDDPLKAACAAGNTADSAICKDRTTTGNPITGSNGIIVKASRIVGVITGVAAVIVITVSGIRYATSTGDGNAVNGAKNAILYAVIGLVVSVLAPIIIQFVLSRINL